MPLESGATLVMVENERVPAGLAGLVCAGAQILTIAVHRKREKKKALALCADMYFSKE
jgi:aerobic-type carbon monoxide dehydrogenase small subunit (CoxS/CutS family)